MLTLHNAKCLNFEPSFCHLETLITKADGNCLVHASSMEINGHDDVDYTERKTLYEYFLNGSMELKKHWKWQESIWNSMDDIIMTEADWEREWELVISLASADIPPSKTQLQSLETIHVFGLANMYKRPIIVVADQWNHIGNVVSRDRFGGIYLPILHKPEQCSKNPIIIAYRASHFNAMTTSLDEGALLFPLTNHNAELLVIPYIINPMKRKNTVKEMTGLLEKYFDVEVVNKSGKSFLCAKYGPLVPNSMDLAQEIDTHHSGNSNGGEYTDNLEMEVFFDSPSYDGKSKICEKKQQKIQRSETKIDSEIISGNYSK